MSGQPLILDRLMRLIPPPGSMSARMNSRLTAASFFFTSIQSPTVVPYDYPAMGQDDQATLMEQQLFIGAACPPQPVSPSLYPPSDPRYVAANPDPRFILWTGYFVSPAAQSTYDPTPSPVSAPSILGTGTSTASGASGLFLDQWGAALGNARWGYWDTTQSPPVWTSETDSAFALRILSDIARPSTTNRGLAMVLNAAFGISGGLTCNVVDAAAGTGGHRFSNSTLGYVSSTVEARAGNLTTGGEVGVASGSTPSTGARASGFVAGNSSLAGCFVVQIPLARNGDGSIGPLHITPALVNALVNRRKAAGTQCTSVLASGEY